MGMNQGIKSKNVSHRSAPKVEPSSRAVREQRVGQIGTMMGDHVTNRDSTGYRPGPLYGGKGYNNPVGPTSMALSGPGAGREVLRSGGQGTHGAPAQGAEGLPSTKNQWPDKR
jgi:hypothetical protein